jgi:syntaxin 1B/2/3
MNSNRYGESRAAYREVQERHEDIKRIERTIAELAQLFNDVRLCAHYVIAWLILS